MPCYALVCQNGHRFEVIRPMSEAPRVLACEECGAEARRDYRAEGAKLAIVDGEHSGYYPEETGFPVDPRNPAKRICPSKHAAKSAFARLRDETQGGMSYE